MLHKFIFKICLLSLGIIFFGCKESLNVADSQLTILGENSATMLALQRDSGAYKFGSNYNIRYKPVDYEDSIPSILKNFDINYGLNDMVLLYNFSFPEIINANLVYNLDELIKDEPTEKFSFVNDILPNAWNEGGSYFHSIGGNETQPTKINYPVAMNTMVLVYNKKMFEDEENKINYEKKFHRKLTIPTEWSEFYDIASFFTDTEKKTFGVAMQGEINGYLYYEFCNYFFGMGAKIFDKNSGWSGNKNTPIIINNADAITANTFYKILKPFSNDNCNFLHVDGSVQNK
ncbi:MAG: extracellular solute-binding protein, partial [Sediminibacterium sp.]|nr:extracellular solute-binding protein [Sediminibacterium sp.]